MNKKIMRKFYRNMERTWKNKLCGLALLVFGSIPIVMYNDGTFMVLALLFGLGLIFEKENVIY